MKFDVLDHGEVRLLSAMADDLDVVASARVSLGVTPELASKGPERDGKLISFLMDNGHGSPFEHSVFRLYIRAPLFVVREHQRHRIGSFNEMSGRYAQLKRLYYVPSAVRGPDASNRQSSVEVPGLTERGLLEDLREQAETAFNTYEALLAAGMAREMARMVLPLSTYTAYWWSVNARSLMNFLMLRNHPAAQLEMRAYAEAFEAIFSVLMPLTHAAFVAHDRRAP